MPESSKSTKISTKNFASSCQDILLSVKGTSVKYFSALPLDDKEEARLVRDPISAVPPKVWELVPKLRLVFVPFLERHPRSKKERPRLYITADDPPEGRKYYTGTEETRGQTFLFLAMADEGDGFDAHSAMYQWLAEVIADRADPELAVDFFRQVDAELSSNTPGEINDGLWELKQELLRSQAEGAELDEIFMRYRLDALRDTMGLYLHGLCCDLTLEASPKQLASKHIRNRLLYFHARLPPPPGIALFPEELQKG